MGMIKLRAGNRWGGRVPSTGRSGRGWRRGFTLVELMVVITIIAIILSFVLLAANDAARRAEERATQSLITKLEGGLNDRIDALMQSRPDPNWSHGFMAAVWNGTYGLAPTLLLPNGILNPQIKSAERAQVFAWYDYIKREVPDVFFLQNDPNFPINFAGQGFHGTPNISPNGTYANYVLPLGNSIAQNPGNGDYGDGNLTNPTFGPSGLGIFGASYPNAAALFKNLPGVQSIGYDGVDNNGDNLVDDIGEGGWNIPLPQLGGLSGLQVLQQNHSHVTARAEMLYAILVEGSGPWGSVFSRDDFTDREVRDTDGDGLPEFVDAWGQPLQFFRWPVLYHSDLQRGQVILPDPNTQGGVTFSDLLPPYQTINPVPTSSGFDTTGSVYQERERDTLDPNQQLTAPQWWARNGVGGQFAANDSEPAFCNGGGPAQAPGASGGVLAFESFFHKLTEPVPLAGTAAGLYWDRGGVFPRRAFYTKFLILSGGRDKQPGVFLYSDAVMKQLATSAAPGAAPYLIANENNALPFALDVFGGGTITPNGFLNTVFFPTGGTGTPSFPATSSNDPTTPSSYDLQQSAKDDISNHNLQSVSGIGGSG
jgi:prepilin-type N-terminal cleavage/methylation domain-containing protein